MQKVNLGGRSTVTPFSARKAGRCGRKAVAIRAQGPSNPIGIHAQVWVGDWSKDEAVKAISGTKKAGYDLIERESITGMQQILFFSPAYKLITGFHISRCEILMKLQSIHACLAFLH